MSQSHTFSVKHAGHRYFVAFTYWPKNSLGFVGPATQAFIYVDRADVEGDFFSGVVGLFHRDKPNAEVGRRKALKVACEELDRATRIAIWTAYTNASYAWADMGTEDGHGQRLLACKPEPVFESAIDLAMSPLR